MSRVVRFIVVGLMMISAPGSMVWAQEQGWQLSFDVVARRFIVKEPIWSTLTVTNTSNTAQPTRGFSGRFYLDDQERACRYDRAPVVETVIDEPSRTAAKTTPVPPMLEPPGATHVARVDLGKECNLVRRGETVIGEHTVCYRDQENASLLSASACVSFVIEAPDGIDKEAYEAFDRNPLGDSERWGELLRRFSTSTYAAYVVWKQGAKGTAGTKVENALHYMAGNVRYGNSAPCDDEARCDNNDWMALSADEIVTWEDRWFDVVLKNHPNIWFSDEVRLKLALDHYLLGDKDGCADSLEELADHGRPDVATKAGDLLSAMKAKGMLEEKGK